ASGAHRADAHCVHQRAGEAPEHERRDDDERDRDDEQQRSQLAEAHASISSSSSSPWAARNDRSRSTGMSRLKTSTSFSSPLQNEAKLSKTPTASAPTAVS